MFEHKISSNVSASWHAWHLKPFKEFTRYHAEDIAHATSLIAKILELDTQSLSVVITPLTEKSTLGFIRADTNIIYLDPRRKSLADITITLIHELRHFWQYQTGKLKWDGRHYWWEGKIYPFIDYDFAHYASRLDEYYNDFPWEADAYDSEDPIYLILSHYWDKLPKMPFIPCNQKHKQL